MNTMKKTYKYFLILIPFSLCFSVRGELIKKVEFKFDKFNAKVEMNFTRPPRVLFEGIAHLKMVNSAGKQIAFPADDNSVEVELKALDSEVIAPKPEIHFNYKDNIGRMASRFFFTAGGRWIIKMTIKDGDLLTESQEKIVTLVNDNNFPKDTESFPYYGKIAHRYVGILGGTGCRRRWDFVDTHDSLHMNMPYDLCGKYAMVSSRYLKWVDLSKDGDKVEKLQLSPLKGDGVLEKMSCADNQEIYALRHYPVCGEEGSIIAYCDKAGNALSVDLIECEGIQK